MKKNILNTSGTNPNYLNTSTTSREVEFNEISPIEGNLSEALKKFKVVFQDDFYPGNNTIVYSEIIISSGEIENK